MKCENCLLVEMSVDRIEDGTIYYRCRKCGSEATEKVEDIEKE